MSLEPCNEAVGTLLSPSGNLLLQTLTSQIDTQRPLVVMPYHWPDLDGLVAALLMQHIATSYLGFSSVSAMFAETPQLEAQLWLLEAKPAFAEFLLTGEEQILLVDTCRLEDLPASVNADAVVGVIDHHMHHVPSRFPHASMQIEAVGAATTLVGELLLHLSASGAMHEGGNRTKLDPDLAKATYLAIATSTIGFTAESLTSRDTRVADHMLSITGISHQAGQRLYEELLIEKTHRIVQDISLAIRTDIPSQPDIVAAYSVIGAELQVWDAKHFIEGSLDACLAELRLLAKEQNATYSWLLISGFRDQQSYVISPFPEMIAQVAQRVDGSYPKEVENPGVLIDQALLPAMMTRKALFALLRRG